MSTPSTAVFTAWTDRRGEVARTPLDPLTPYEFVVREGGENLTEFSLVTDARGGLNWDDSPLPRRAQLRFEATPVAFALSRAQEALLNV